MPEYLRVKEKTTGDHHSVIAGEYHANPDAYVLLKQDAVNGNGDPLASEPAESTGQSATTKKES